MEYIVGLKIASSVKTNHTTIQTLKNLNLLRRNSMILVEDSPSVLGAIKAVSSKIVWSRFSSESKLLIELKQFIKKKKSLDLVESKKINLNLNSPKKGFKQNCARRGYLENQAMIDLYISKMLYRK